MWAVLIPEGVARVGHGMLLACINPVLCHIADIRHNGHYGIVNGLYTATYNLGLFVGKSYTLLFASLSTCMSLMYNMELFNGIISRFVF